MANLSITEWVYGVRAESASDVTVRGTTVADTVSAVRVARTRNVATEGVRTANNYEGVSSIGSSRLRIERSTGVTVYALFGPELGRSFADDRTRRPWAPPDGNCAAPARVSGADTGERRAASGVRRPHPQIR